MTPELHKEIIVGCVAAVSTALFTGIPAVLLFWWTWQRDQERVIVKKLISNWPTLTGPWVPEKDAFGPVFDILARNRSLYPVHISAAGFYIDGEAIQLEHPGFLLKMKQNPDATSRYRYIADDDSDCREIPSQKLTTIGARNAEDRVRIKDALQRAAERRGISVGSVLTSPRVVAVVALESGREFTSESFSRRHWRSIKSRIARTFRVADVKWLIALVKRKG